MPVIHGAFIDPAVLFGKVKQATKVPAIPGLALGPSAPHDDEPDEPELPPPRVGEGHYTNVLDQLWPEFDTPEERTAARLKALFEKVVDEAGRMNLAIQDFLDSVPSHKLSLADRLRLRAEFLAYLKRLNVYRVRLEELAPESTDTQSVYVGLVQTRPGAGPVPDAIMHLYFQNQLGVLAEHVQDMSEGFVARVFDALAYLRDSGIEAQDAIRDAQEQAVVEAKKWRWVAGAAIGTVALAVIGSLAVAFGRRGSTS
ncbi:hypothetical protein ACNOYE_07395 [Nannocystaceae bacterium ST9]